MLIILCVSQSTVDLTSWISHQSQPLLLITQAKSVVARKLDDEVAALTEFEISQYQVRLFTQ